MRRGRKIAAAGPQPHQVGAQHCGQRLRWARLWRELSLEQLENSSGYCREVLRRIELGRMRCELLLVEQRARSRGVRRQWLAFGVGKVAREQGEATAARRAPSGDTRAA
jgi:hypothetical protein